MRKIFCLSFSLLTLGLCLSACKDRSPEPKHLSNETVNSDTAGSKNNQIWPPPAPEGEPVALAANLLAKNYYILLDGSGSMTGNECSEGEANKSAASKKALKEFIKSVPTDANIGLLAFDSAGITERLPLDVNNQAQQAEFIGQIDKVRADSQTPLHTSISLALRALEKQARAQLGYGEYHMVIVTDGHAVPAEEEDPTKIVKHILDNTPITIHTIGFCIDENHTLNQPGRTNYATAQNPRELIDGLKRVLAEAEQFDLVKFE